MRLAICIYTIVALWLPGILRALNKTAKFDLHAVDYLNPSIRLPNSSLVDVPKNFPLFATPAGYYLIGTLNSVDLRFHIDLQSSAIYLYENFCESCEFSPRLADQYENWKSALTTVLKYCQVSYRACEYFEDDNYSGYYSKQQLSFDDIMLEKLGTYTVRIRHGDSSTGLFASPTVFGIIGLGRTDSDQKYQHSSKEEFVGRYDLDTSDLSIHFHQKGSVTLGKKFLVETLKGVQVHEFPIIHTGRISFEAEALVIGLPKQVIGTTELISIPLEAELVLSSTRQDNCFPQPVFDSLLNITKRSLENLKPTIPELLNITATHKTLSFYWSAPNGTLNDLPAPLVSLLTITLQSSKSLPLPLSPPFVLAGCSNSSCLFLLAFSPCNSPILGLHFLQSRLLHISSDSFRISSPVDPSVVKEAPVEDYYTGGVWFGLLAGIALTLPVLYKSVQGCLKSIGV